MNNKFSDFVKRVKISVLLALIGFFLAFVILAVVIVVLIESVPIPILVIPCFLILFGIVFYITIEKQRKRVVKYRLGVDVDNNIYIPLVLDNDYLKKVSSVFNHSLEVPDNIDNLVSYVQYMIDNNQMIFVQKKFKLEDIINLLNSLMKHQNINYSIDKNDIIKTDDEIISLRRKDNIINDTHDLAIIRSILESNQLELINFFASNDGFSKFARIDGYILTVVPINKVETFRKYQIELANKLNYR